MNPTAIYSKSGKGVQEASGKTSLLKRPDRAVLSAIDGRANLQEVAQKCGKTFDAAFQAVITQLDKDGFIREVSAGTAPAAPPKPAAAAPKPGAKPAAKADDGGGFGDLDFSSMGGASKPASPPSRPAAPPPPPKPAAAPPPKPAPPVSQQLDFSSIGMAPKPAAAAPKPAAAPAPPPQQQVDALSKAREEAEARAAAERERMRAEAEAKTRAEMEAKLRAEAEKKMKDDAAAKASADAAAEAKVKAAREAALKAAEAKVKVEQEAKAKIEAERKAREETEKRLEAERKAREEAEKKAKEEAERARREAEEKARKEQEELRQRLEAERKAREEAERKAKEEAERARKELEEERKRLEAERKKEEEERAARLKREQEEAEARRRKREEEERKEEEERAAARKKRQEEEAAREAEEQAQREAEREAKRKKREAEEAERERVEAELRAEEKRKKAAAPPAAAPAPKAEAKKDSFADSLLADLDSFTNREDEELKAKAEAEQKQKAEAERRQREEAERQAKEQAERERREQEEARRREEEARRAREEEERRAQEEERRKREAEEIRRKAEAATAAAMAKEGKSPAKVDDIPIDDDDLDMDEVKKERAALAKARPKDEEPAPIPVARKKKDTYDEPVRARRPANWGKRIAVTLVLLAVIGFGVLHVMPVSTAEYERAATEALGRPVKIGSAKMWLVTGPQVRLQDVTVGDAKISLVTAAIGSAFGERKELGTVELDGLTLPQQSLGEAIFANVRGDNFRVERIVVKSLQLPGPAVLPKSMQADIQLDGKGAMRTATIRGPDGLLAKLTPKDSSIEFDVIAAGFTLPIAPEITLSKFAMKGTATPRGMTVAEWGGAIFNGGISGTANIRWGATWNVDGVVTVRGINAAVFAPALVSGGTGEGTGKFSMNGADPAKLATTGRLDGNFTVTQGTLGSFDLARAIQSSGKNFAGTTQFSEMNGQAVFDRGAIALRNVTIGAGALNAGASADIASSGALSGRIVADIKAASQVRSATLLLGGTVKEPQVRN